MARLAQLIAVRPKLNTTVDTKQQANRLAAIEYNDNNAVEFKKREAAVPANSGKQIDPARST